MASGTRSRMGIGTHGTGPAEPQDVVVGEGAAHLSEMMFAHPIRPIPTAIHPSGRRGLRRYVGFIPGASRCRRSTWLRVAIRPSEGAKRRCWTGAAPPRRRRPSRRPAACAPTASAAPAGLRPGAGLADPLRDLVEPLHGLFVDAAIASSDSGVWAWSGQIHARSKLASGLPRGDRNDQPDRGAGAGSALVRGGPGPSGCGYRGNRGLHCPGGGCA